MILDVVSVSCVSLLVTSHILRSVLYDYGPGSMFNKLVCRQHIICGSVCIVESFCQLACVRVY